MPDSIKPAGTCTSKTKQGVANPRSSKTTDKVFPLAIKQIYNLYITLKNGDNEHILGVGSGVVNSIADQMENHNLEFINFRAKNGSDSDVGDTFCTNYYLKETIAKLQIADSHNISCWRQYSDDRKNWRWA